eukprot:s1795_g3.t1
MQPVIMHSLDLSFANFPMDCGLDLRCSQCTGTRHWCDVRQGAAVDYANRRCQCRPSNISADATSPLGPDSKRPCTPSALRCLGTGAWPLSRAPD